MSDTRLSSIYVSEADALAELRALLLAPEQADLRQLKQRIESTDTAERISRALPEAVRLAAERNSKLDMSLRPILHRGLRIILRRDPSILNEVLPELIGDLVKSAVLSALRQLSETIQESLEHSVSLRGIAWRAEAIRSGRPFADIVLARSLLYRVDRVLLIHRETGLLLAQVAAESNRAADNDLISGMLTAIHDFVRDSFGNSAQSDMQVIESGEFVIWTLQSSQAVLGVLIRGIPPRALKLRLESTLERISREYSTSMASFEGDIGAFDPCKDELRACLLGRGSKARRTTLWPLWTLVVICTLVMSALVYGQVRQARRWNALLRTLRTEPGLIITEASRSGGTYFISGLRDPLARDPAQLIRHAGYRPSDINSSWQGYLSMQQPFLAQREFADAKKRVEGHKIYFLLDSAQLSPEELAVIEDTADDIKTLVACAARIQKRIRIEVSGEADSSGKGEHNSALAQQRATEVALDLTAAGVPKDSLSARGISRERASDQLPAFRRSVAFRVLNQ